MHSPSLVHSPKSVSRTKCLTPRLVFGGGCRRTNDFCPPFAVVPLPKSRSASLLLLLLIPSPRPSLFSVSVPARIGRRRLPRRQSVASRRFLWTQRQIIQLPPPPPPSLPHRRCHVRLCFRFHAYLHVCVAAILCCIYGTMCSPCGCVRRVAQASDHHGDWGGINREGRREQLVFIIPSPFWRRQLGFIMICAT